MINFSFPKNIIRAPRVPKSGSEGSYQKYFHQALLNLELNLQEERLKQKQVS